jgi:hypothetical protein
MGAPAIPGDDYVLPFGRARIVREGTDLTLVTWGAMVHRCVPAASGFGERVEVIDLRTIAPWDREAMLSSVRKTGRCLIVHEDNRTAGFGAEIAAPWPPRRSGTWTRRWSGSRPPTFRCPIIRCCWRRYCREWRRSREHPCTLPLARDSARRQATSRARKAADAFGAHPLILAGYIGDAPTVLSTECPASRRGTPAVRPSASPNAPEPVA